MSRKPDDLELDYIHQIAKSSLKVQDLITTKNKENIELQNKQQIKYKEPNIAPSPSGDIRLSKVHKQTLMDDKILNEKIEQNHSKFDKQIKQEMDRLVAHPDHEPVKAIVQDMNAKDLSTLSEKGPEIYKQAKEKEEKAIEQSIKLDFDDSDKFNKHPSHKGFLDNYEDIIKDKRPSINDNFE